MLPVIGCHVRHFLVHSDFIFCMHVLQMNIIWNNRETATANSKRSLKDLGKIVTCSLLDLDLILSVSISHSLPYYSTVHILNEILF